MDIIGIRFRRTVSELEFSSYNVRAYSNCFLTYFMKYRSDIVDEGISKELFRYIKRKNN